MALVTEVLRQLDRSHDRTIPQLARSLGRDPREVSDAVRVLLAQGLALPCRDSYSLTKLGHRMAEPSRRRAGSAH
jgi:Mn-dependent DtxR family transcriptional regulator